jgi:hypothetical protein
MGSPEASTDLTEQARDHQKVQGARGLATEFRSQTTGGPDDRRLHTAEWGNILNQLFVADTALLPAGFSSRRLLDQHASEGEHALCHHCPADARRGAVRNPVGRHPVKTLEAVPGRHGGPQLSV